MNALLQKPRDSIKKWSIAGIIAACVFYVCYIFVGIYTNMAYYNALTPLDFASLFLQYNGIFITAVLVFLIGLFVVKKREFFLQFMLWAMLLIGLYFYLPLLPNVPLSFFAYSGLDLMSYLGIMVPFLLACVLLISAIIQKESAHAAATNMIAWISIVVGILLLIFQIAAIAGQAANIDGIGSVLGLLARPAAIAVAICLSFVFLNATKTAPVLCAQELPDTAAGFPEETAAGPDTEPFTKAENPEDLVERVSDEE